MWKMENLDAYIILTAKSESSQCDKMKNLSENFFQKNKGLRRILNITRSWVS